MEAVPGYALLNIQTGLDFADGVALFVDARNVTDMRLIPAISVRASATGRDHRLDQSRRLLPKHRPQRLRRYPGFVLMHGAALIRSRGGAARSMGVGIVELGFTRPRSVIRRSRLSEPKSTRSRCHRVSCSSRVCATPGSPARDILERCQL